MRYKGLLPLALALVVSALIPHDAAAQASTSVPRSEFGLEAGTCSYETSPTWSG
jgi:hypothetical protein